MFEAGPSGPAAPLLQASGLRWRVGDAGRAQLDLALPPGRVLRVVGPSGAGKTTLLRVLARLHPRLGGELRLRGLAAESLAPAQWRRQVLFVAQQPVLFAGTVRDNLLVPWRIPAWRRHPAPEPGPLAAAAAALGLEERLLEREAALLSGGEGARVCLARALLVDPPVLLADEPFAFLDPETTDLAALALARWAARDSRALVLVSHTPPPAALAGWSELDAGRLLQGEGPP